MYINDLGIGRIASNHTVKSASTVYGKNTDSYGSVMKQAVDQQKTAVNPTFATAGDIIIQEAFEKMKTDPEWEKTVLNKVKDYYAGNYKVDSMEKSYLNLMGQNVLQNYMVQSMMSGLGMTGYSAYGFENPAASIYGSALGSLYNNSLLGDWQL